MHSFIRLGLPLCLLGLSAAVAAEPIPTLAEAVASKRDLWGELAMKQPNGASYEFFEPLLPPPRYTHADFRYYPLVMSAPAAAAKARLISDGSGINLRGGSRSWKDIGTPVVFRVGPDEFRFGGLRDRLSLPQPAEGWLPIYEITYRHAYPVQSEGLVPVNQKPIQREPEVYRLEAFVSTEPALAAHAVVFVRFSLAQGEQGLVTVQLDPPVSPSPLTPLPQGGRGEKTATPLPQGGEGRQLRPLSPQRGERGRGEGGQLVDSRGQPAVWADRTWQRERTGLHARLKPGSAATLAIPTMPLPDGALKLDANSYAHHRELTTKTWKDLIAHAMQVSIPEPRVNDAWKNLLVQNFMLLVGDRMLYSNANQYEALYEAEGSDAALAMMNWGYEDDAKKMFVPLLDFTRKGLEHHQAGLKLNDVERCWWQTRDVGWVKAMRPRWEKEVNRLLNNRSGPDGLLPKERYCGDIATPVYALSVESKAWRALHDLPPVLRAIGDTELAERAARAEADSKVKMLDALNRSLSRETWPPFIPNALLSDERVHDPITGTRIGSYWNLMVNYNIGARLFPTGSDEEQWLPHYLETHGGLCMGMVRSGGTAHAFWTGPDRINPLYGTRYVVDCLRRDDVERALVSFYGMLAQGFTRNTLIAGEGCTLQPVDAGGRFFYCPPNSAGNAHFLTMLRTMLVQDLDTDDDGEPETLRLLFGTSRRWLDDGRKLAIERAPTVFGPVTVKADSHLKDGYVTCAAELPSRNPPRRTLLRARVPEGWRVTGARIGSDDLKVDDRGTVDLSGRNGTVKVRFAVKTQ